ncbi:MAG: hypothetical protein MRJ96_10210 [Nitrospirales bacterium]|nr:hypothetical protein [Nitrospira sp.]MDR4501811.1 hypothetical protein [Nitrospirales bacterium]
MTFDYFKSQHGLSRLMCMMLVVAMSACVGKFETKPDFTEACLIDWKTQATIDESGLPSVSTGHRVHVLVWNIHDRLLGESAIAKGGHTEGEVVCIGEIATRYDLVLFQEAYVRPAQIARYTNHAWSHHPVFEEGGGGDWWPLRAFCEICLTPGLLMLAREEPGPVYSEPYEAFAGWNTKRNKADDFFSKGFQLVNFEKFWALNSHMDSGRGQASIDARVLQFRQITNALKRLVPQGAPLLIGMDSNLRSEQEPQDGKILEEFLEANGLTLVRHVGPDLIAVRNLQVENPQVLPLKGVLSDHNALTVVIDPAVSGDPSR